MKSFPIVSSGRLEFLNIFTYMNISNQTTVISRLLSTPEYVTSIKFNKKIYRPDRL